MLKNVYVTGAQAARQAVQHLGVTPPRPGERGAGAHLRSLLHVHDVEALIGSDLPWWTYRATDVVDSFLQGRRGAAKVFEYGSGASTVWLARRSAVVHSVEHDEQWAGILSPRLEAFGHVTLHRTPPAAAVGPSSAPSGRRGHEHLDFAEYVRTIEHVGGPFDLIVVDGRARMSCLSAAVSHLAPDGIIVVDNSRRRRYQLVLNSLGMRVRRFRGAAPGLPYPDETAVLDRQ